MLRPCSIPTLNALNLNLLDEIWLDEGSGMPTVGRSDVVPERLIPFNKTKRREDHRGAVHFYIDDHCFTHFWTSPTVYLQRLIKFDAVISPDFSTYLDMPDAMIRWQIYRRRFLSQWMQRSGVSVIYNIQTLPRIYDNMQLNGIDGGGVIAMRPPLRYAHNGMGRRLFVETIEAAIERLSPRCMLIYGDKIPLPNNINYFFYENDNYRQLRTTSDRGKGKVLDCSYEAKKLGR